MKRTTRRHSEAERGAVERLRNTGISKTEAPTEIVRQDSYEWIDPEADGENIALRLRIVKP